MDDRFNYINESGKTVRGSAAFTHHVFSAKGGVENYDKAIMAATINELVSLLSDGVRDALIADVRKSKFKLVQ